MLKSIVAESYHDRPKVAKKRHQMSFLTRLLQPKTLYIHIHVYIISLATSWMIALLTTHKILHKRRIKGLVYWTRSSVIFIGPGLLGFLDRGLCAYNVIVYNLRDYRLGKALVTK